MKRKLNLKKIPSVSFSAKTGIAVIMLRLPQIDLYIEDLFLLFKNSFFFSQMRQ